MFTHLFTQIGSHLVNEHDYNITHRQDTVIYVTYTHFLTCAHKHTNPGMLIHSLAKEHTSKHTFTHLFIGMCFSIKMLT